MKKRVAILLILSLIITQICGVTVIPVYAEVANHSIESKINRAQEWLASTKNEDGTYEGQHAFNTTCKVLNALPDTGYQEKVNKGKVWVEEQLIFNNIDMYSRWLMIEEQDTEAIAYILACQNEDGGFGLNENYASDIWDSLLVLEAFNDREGIDYQDEMFGLISYFITVQNEDGGWSYGRRSASDASLTARIGGAIGHYIQKVSAKADILETVFEKVDHFLMPYTHYTFDEDTIIEDAYVYTYFKQKEKLFESDEYLETLLDSQQSDGSFFGDIHTTAVVVSLLEEFAKKEKITTQVEGLDTTLNLTSTLVGNDATVIATSEIVYDTNIDKYYTITLQVIDGTTTLYETTTTAALYITQQKVAVEQSFQIQADEARTLKIVTQLLDGQTVVEEMCIDFEICDRENKTDVLLIESTLPWNSNANSIVLNQIGVNYKKIAISQVSEIDFLDYRLIIVANDQSNSTYRVLGQLRPQIESFVRNGGTLLYGVCDNGWGGNGTSDAVIPGDIQIDPVNYQNNNYIVDETHPIITGELSDGVPLTNADLISNYASHRNFTYTSLPEDTNVILTAQNNQSPTLVEYKVGKGVVVASGLTWEHNYNKNNHDFGRKALDDLFLYAYSITYENIDAADPGLVICDITTDKTAYTVGEEMQIHLKSTLSSFRRTATAVIEITDVEGNRIAVIRDDIQEVLTVGVDTEHQAKWMVEPLLAGPYKVKVSWWDVDECIGEAESTFTILSDKKLENSVHTNQQIYTTGQAIFIENVIENRSSNGIERDIEVKTTVLDSNAKVVQTYKDVYQQCLPGDQTSYKYTLETDQLVSGVYRVVSELLQNDEIVAESETSFEFVFEEEVINLQGSIRMTKEDDGVRHIRSEVTNKATNRVDKVGIQISIYNDQSERIQVFDYISDIRTEETLCFENSVDTYALEPGDYMLILEAITSEGERFTLDATGFTCDEKHYMDFDKVLCTLGQNPLRIETSRTSIEGDVYAYGGVIYRGSVLDLEGTLSTPKSILAEGSSIAIEEELEHIEPLAIRDYREVILREVEGHADTYNTYVRNGDATIENTILCENEMRVNGSSTAIHGAIVVTNDIVLNTGKVNVTTSAGIVCSLEGDITMNTSDVDIENCFIYAPNGTVCINASEVDLVGHIVAKEIIIRASKVEIREGKRR